MVDLQVGQMGALMYRCVCGVGSFGVASPQVMVLLRGQIVHADLDRGQCGDVTGDIDPERLVKLL